jgi:hypothetical protein
MCHQYLRDALAARAGAERPDADAPPPARTEPAEVPRAVTAPEPVGAYPAG